MGRKGWKGGRGWVASPFILPNSISFTFSSSVLLLTSRPGFPGRPNSPLAPGVPSTPGLVLPGSPFSPALPGVPAVPCSPGLPLKEEGLETGR